MHCFARMHKHSAFDGCLFVTFPVTNTIFLTLVGRLHFLNLCPLVCLYTHLLAQLPHLWLYYLLFLHESLFQGSICCGLYFTNNIQTLYYLKTHKQWRSGKRSSQYISLDLEHGRKVSYLNSLDQNHEKVW